MRYLSKLIVLIFFSKLAFAFHEVEVANEDVAALGGLWTQIYVYEEYCADDQYYTVVFDRLMVSPRFERYSAELEHLTADQELSWERGGAGAAALRVGGAAELIAADYARPPPPREEGGAVSGG